MCWEFIAVEVGSTSQMVALVSKVTNLGHMLNAQLHLRGKASVPFLCDCKAASNSRLRRGGCSVKVSFIGTVVPI